MGSKRSIHSSSSSSVLLASDPRTAVTSRQCKEEELIRVFLPDFFEILRLCSSADTNKARDSLGMGRSTAQRCVFWQDGGGS